MRSLFLVLLLANLLFAAVQSGILGPVLGTDGTRVEQMNPDKLRLVSGAAARR